MLSDGKATGQIPAEWMVQLLYNQHVVISADKAHSLEIATRAQQASELWHDERRLRLTASDIKPLSIESPTQVVMLLPGESFPQASKACRPLGMDYSMRILPSMRITISNVHRVYIYLCSAVGSLSVFLLHGLLPLLTVWF